METPHGVAVLGKPTVVVNVRLAKNEIYADEPGYKAKYYDVNR
jgi:hypothetical protein